MTDDEKRARQHKYEKKYRETHLEQQRKKVRDYHAKNKEKILAQRRGSSKRKESRRKWLEANKERVREYYRRSAQKRKAQADQWKRERLQQPQHRLRYMLNAARWRARHVYAIDFDEHLFDELVIPDRCPCCLTPFELTIPKGLTRSERRKRHSPSIDRVDNTQGYTLCNTAIICTHCNVLKQDTTLAELKMLVAYVERELKKRKLEKQ